MIKFTQRLLLLAIASPILALSQTELQTEPVDQAVINRIRKEGLENSKVMDIAFNLTDMSGNRLANSPGYLRAANYAINTLKGWGVEKADLDAWGEFGKGWELEKSYMAMTAPYYRPIMIYPKTWTAGNKKLQNAEVLVISAKDSTDMLKYTGQLKGKVLMMDQLVTYKQSFKADAVRYTDEELAKMEAATMAPTKPVDTAAQRRQQQAMAQQRGGAARMMTILKEMAKAEGAVAMLSSGGVRSHDGTVFAQGGGAYKGTDPENFLDIAVGIEDFNSILRIAKTGTPVKLDVDVKTKFHTKDLQGYNVIGEIPGTDPVLKNEIVMIGAHLDSWQAGTGATDNASGSAVMMEVKRILKTLNISTKRTIRIGLWSAEEQGLWGSRGYVKKTFADPANMNLLPQHEKFSGYFNIDNGTGKIRGIYLQGNEACRNIFKAWLTPFNDLGAGAVTISNTGGTDHQSFDAVGLPGFQFIQDPIEFDTRTHHSNMDVYDHLIEADLKQMATVVASFVYHTAQRDAKLPRKALPAARPGAIR
ncbi:MAG: M20/M25/M40 family metallo-hydrolase [Sediminibacterium sp.]|nr:M20/M25/M40 family metallo-hydrolase [Sediminibacterium sp.]